MRNALGAKVVMRDAPCQPFLRPPRIVCAPPSRAEKNGARQGLVALIPFLAWGDEGAGQLRRAGATPLPGRRAGRWTRGMKKLAW